MDVRRELNEHPPKEPLTSIQAIVRDFYDRFPPQRRDMVIEFAAHAPDYESAVVRACNSRDEKGKMHNHQSRVPQAVKDRLAQVLIERRKAVMRCSTFDELHDLIWLHRFPGVGPVLAYDVSVRLAAWFLMTPESLYLHAGVKIGWEALTGQRTRKDRILRHELPDGLHDVPADDIEDILCTYRHLFEEWRQTA